MTTGTRTLNRPLIVIGGVICLYLIEALWLGTWNTTLNMVNYSLIAAIIALGINIQWGYAGLFSVGTVGFVGLGGLAPVLTSSAPRPENFAAGGWQIIGALILGVAAVALAILVNRRTTGRVRLIATLAVLIGGFFAYRAVFDPAVLRVEAINPENAGNIGGLGLDSILGLHVGVLIAWPLGALMAAGAAWVIGRTALGLRSDYLAIATLGISEILLAAIRNEDWLARGVKNLTDIPRPVPYEVELQQGAAWQSWADLVGTDPITLSTILVKLCWAALFSAVLLALIWLTQRAINSPWGRMMRAIRDNEVAAEAMGKNVTGRHLQVFVLGSAICGLAGAMLVTFEGQITPGAYNPLRYTFLIWVMVIVGGSGNNWGSVVGAFLLWWVWIKAEAFGPDFVGWATSFMADSPLKDHLTENAVHARLLALGLILLLVLRFSPRGLLPER
jgi:branched-chain amino acid transport system permease protein